MSRRNPHFDHVLARLHLHAVLPALEELVRISPEAAGVVAGKNFSLRLAVLGGPAVTLRCEGGPLKIFPDRAPRAAVNLLFFSAQQLNRLFTKQPGGWPPLPVGAPWHLPKLRTFVALTQLLDRYLQPPTAGKTAAIKTLQTEPGFREVQTRLLLQVLRRAAPLVAELDPPSAALLAGYPGSSLELQAPTLDFKTRFHANRSRNGNGATAAAAEKDAPPEWTDPADATIVFRDPATLEAALHGRLDAAVAVGLGQLEVRGLIPLADAWSFVLDRVEVYLKPKAGAH